MTEVKEMPSNLGRCIDQVIGDVLRSMEAARRGLDAATGSLLEDGKPEDVNRAAVALSRAFGTVVSEVRRIEDARRIERGGDGLDMAAARAEIECRLGRILAARET